MITPEEMAERMRAIYPTNNHYDTEQAHINADRLCSEVLRDLGYGAAMDIYDTVDVWYA